MPTLSIKLPTLHEDQVRAFQTPGRFKIIRCGRRWGKTDLAVTIAADAAIKGEKIGIFAPDYKRLLEPRNKLFQLLADLKKRSSKTEGQLITKTEGVIDFWTLNDELAGRGREYDGVIVDEAAFAPSNMGDIYNLAIRPTLLTRRGWVLVLSNTNGIDPQQWFYKISTDNSLGFVEYHAPSHGNPYLPREELEQLATEMMPLVFQQEIKAEFVDWSGVAFFALSAMMDENNQPYALPERCDAVFATIDTATKTGKENDGTAVVYWAVTRHGLGVPLMVLDWDIQHIEGALLEKWLPVVFENLAHFAKITGCRRPPLGAWIEDKSSGMVLLQQAARRGWRAHAIDSKLTSVGKVERAISVSGYHWRKMVKISRQAYDRRTLYKGSMINHFLNQVIGFRVNAKDQVDDDLLDCYTYGIALSLGNQEGF